MLMTMRTNWHAAISGIAVLFATFNAFATCPTPGTSDARMYLIVNNTSNPSTARITLAKIGFDVVKVDGFHVKKIGATNFSNYSSFPAAATGLEAANNSASSIAGLKWDGYAAISDYLLIGNAYVGTSSSNAQFWYHDLECNAVYQITNVVWSAN